MPTPSGAFSTPEAAQLKTSRRSPATRQPSGRLLENQCILLTDLFRLEELDEGRFHYEEYRL